EPAATAVGVVIRNNRVHDNDAWGIFTSYAERVLIEHNEASNSKGQGIAVTQSGDEPIIRFNTAHHNMLAGIQLNTDATLPGDGVISNAIIESNTVYENGR